MEIRSCQRLVTIAGMETASHQIWICLQFLCFQNRKPSSQRSVSQVCGICSNEHQRFDLFCVSFRSFKARLICQPPHQLHLIQIDPGILWSAFGCALVSGYDNEVWELIHKDFSSEYEVVAGQGLLIHKHFFTASLSFTQSPCGRHTLEAAWTISIHKQVLHRVEK